jgi:hypothetical protein
MELLPAMAVSAFARTREHAHSMVPRKPSGATASRPNHRTFAMYEGANLNNVVLYLETWWVKH